MSSPIYNVEMSCTGDKDVAQRHKGMSTPSFSVDVIVGLRSGLTSETRSMSSPFSEAKGDCRLEDWAIAQRHKGMSSPLYDVEITMYRRLGHSSEAQRHV